MKKCQCVHILFIFLQLENNLIERIQCQKPEVWSANLKFVKLKPLYADWLSDVANNSGETAASFSTETGGKLLPIQPTVHSSSPPVTAQGDSASEINTLRHPLVPVKHFVTFVYHLMEKKRSLSVVVNLAAEKNLS